MKTYKFPLYRAFIVGCIFAAFNIINVGQLFAQMSNNEILVKKLKVLPRLGYRTTLGLILDANGLLIAFCNVDDLSSRDKNPIFIFLPQHDKWIETEKTYTGSANVIISGDKFQIITYSPFNQDKNPLEVYDLTGDLRIADQPGMSLSLFSEQKFKNEGTREIISVTAGEKPDSFLVLGKYSASNLNLFTFLGRITSAGHAGIVDIPFAAQITEGKVTGFYDLQTKYEDNEYVSNIHGITEGRTVHVTWIKGKNYSSDAPKVMYVQFDLVSHRWSDVTELFRGTKYKSKIVRYFSEPSVLLLDQKFYCAWSNANMQNDRGQPLDKPLGSSGVFYRVRDKDGWGLIDKVSDSEANRCKIAVGKDKEVHLFWIDYQKKVYHACKGINGWQDASMIYEDPALDWTLPFDVKIDQTGNFHLIYIRRVSYAAPIELMYVKKRK
jgi:hypothetical protein